MSRSEESKRQQYNAQRKIHEATLERITINVKKGNKKRYQEHALTRGMSLTSLIVNLLEEDMKK